MLLHGCGPARPFMLEVRHLGGALGTPAAVPNAVGHRDARFNVFTSAYPGPSFADAAIEQTELYRQLEPFTGGRALYNFTARPDGGVPDGRTAFDAETIARLQLLKGRWDPQNLFRFAVAIPSATAIDSSATRPVSV
ncbi:MAG TPA: BBE domain-containing protein [Microlunatus sp.]